MSGQSQSPGRPISCTCSCVSLLRQWLVLLQQKWQGAKFSLQIWLVVSTQLKNISPIGRLSQIGVKIKNIWNHHLVMYKCRPRVGWTPRIDRTLQNTLGVDYHYDYDYCYSYGLLQLLQLLLLLLLLLLPPPPPTTTNNNNHRHHHHHHPSSGGGGDKH